MKESQPGSFQDTFSRRLLSGQARGPAASSARACLAAASLPYALAVRLRNHLYDRDVFHARRASVPVISVGNLTVGGSGKTPFVCFLAQRLTSAGRRVAVLSRGYRSDPDDGLNDETRLLARYLPPQVIQLSGPDRVDLASWSSSHHRCDVILLDDGFQHRRLARDLDVVLVDALEPFGFGHILPRGLLREPLRALRRAHLIALTRTELVTPLQTHALEAQLARLAPGVPVIYVAFPFVHCQSLSGETRLKTDRLSAKHAFCFCGVGNPAAFARTLDQAGITQVGWRIFPDHHHYTPADVSLLGDFAVRAGADVLLTTEKDAVKLQPGWSWPLPLYFVAVQTLVTRGETVLNDLLVRTLTVRTGDRQS